MLQSEAITGSDLYWQEGAAGWQPISQIPGYVAPPLAVPPPPPPPPQAIAPSVVPGPIRTDSRKPTLSCQTCGQGVLVKRKRYRMSVPVVLIGYILLVPCVLGMLFGVLMLFASGSAGSAVSTAAEHETRNRLEAQGIPEPIIQKVVEMKSVSIDETSTLNPGQKRVVDDARLSLSAGKVGAGAGAVLGGGISIFIIISCFVGGLLGWLLVMKKRVLQCNQCSAVVAAS